MDHMFPPDLFWVFFYSQINKSCFIGLADSIVVPFWHVVPMAGGVVSTSFFSYVVLNPYVSINIIRPLWIPTSNPSWYVYDQWQVIDPCPLTPAHVHSTHRFLKTHYDHNQLGICQLPLRPTPKAANPEGASYFFLSLHTWSLCSPTLQPSRGSLRHTP